MSRSRFTLRTLRTLLAVHGRGRALAAVCAAALVASGCSSPEPELAFEGARFSVDLEMERVRTVLRQLDAAFTNGDLAAVGVHYADDVVHLPPGEAPVVGLDAVHARDSTYLAEYDAEVATAIEELGLMGNTAFARYTYTESWTPKAGGESTSVAGKGIALFRRDESGAWKVTHWIWNLTGTA